jgi:hypothetical protein
MNSNQAALLVVLLLQRAGILARQLSAEDVVKILAPMMP